MYLSVGDGKSPGVDKSITVLPLKLARFASKQQYNPTASMYELPELCIFARPSLHIKSLEDPAQKILAAMASAVRSLRLFYSTLMQVFIFSLQSSRITFIYLYSIPCPQLSAQHTPVLLSAYSAGIRAKRSEEHLLPSSTILPPNGNHRNSSTYHNSIKSCRTSLPLNSRDGHTYYLVVGSSKLTGMRETQHDEFKTDF
jgi:hypothetical protein